MQTPNEIMAANITTPGKQILVWNEHAAYDEWSIVAKKKKEPESDQAS